MAGTKPNKYTAKDPFAGYSASVFDNVQFNQSTNTIFKANQLGVVEEYVFDFDGKLIPTTTFFASVQSKSKKERSILQKYLKSIGLNIAVTDGGYDSTGNFEKILVGYAQANAARNYALYQNSTDKTKFSPVNLNIFIKDYAGSGKDTSGGPKKTIDYNAPFTPAQAKDVANTLASKFLGQKATDAQSALVLDAINTLLKSKPDTTTTTVSGDVQTTKRTTGVTSADIESVAGSILKKSPEYKPYQIATTYYDALIKTIDNPSVSF